jgi:hypothetical protein
VSQPFYPSANPGGEHTWLVCNALKNWVDAADIPGILECFLSLRPQLDWDTVEIPGNDHATIVYINMARNNESRQANTGPNNPGGKEIIYSMELRVEHRGSSVDGWDAAQQDFYRILDALKDCLRAEGRDLGRPDVILMAGDWPGEIVTITGEPVFDETNGHVDRSGQIQFDVYQYLADFYPAQ